MATAKAVPAKAPAKAAPAKAPAAKWPPAVVQKVLVLKRHGLSERAISCELRKTKFQSPTGKTWWASSVESILKLASQKPSKE